MPPVVVTLHPLDEPFLGNVEAPLRAAGLAFAAVVVSVAGRSDARRVA